MARLEASGLGERLMRLQAAAVPRGHARAYSRTTMTAAEVGKRNMSTRTITGGAVGLALILGLSACTNPYDPAQRTIGGGLLAGGYMREFGNIAESHPGLKIHIDHLGRHGGGAGGTDDAAWADLPDMLGRLCPAAALLSRSKRPVIRSGA